MDRAEQEEARKVAQPPSATNAYALGKGQVNFTLGVNHHLQHAPPNQAGPPQLNQLLHAVGIAVCPYDFSFVNGEGRRSIRLPAEDTENL
jgi:hypothetical protein